MKRWFCDRCGREIDLDHDGFARMRVDWWSRGEVRSHNAERMEYKPDFRHREGTEEYMLCAKCANETFGQLDGMEDA